LFCPISYKFYYGQIKL